MRDLADLLSVLSYKLDNNVRKAFAEKWTSDAED